MLIVTGILELLVLAYVFWFYLYRDPDVTTFFLRTFILGSISGPFIFAIFFLKTTRKAAFAAAAGFCVSILLAVPAIFFNANPNQLIDERSVRSLFLERLDLT